MKEAVIEYAIAYKNYYLYLCGYVCNNGITKYALCPSKKLFTVGARAPIGFFKSGDDYIMYIKKGE